MYNADVLCTVGVIHADNYFPKSSFSILPLQSFFLGLVLDTPTFVNCATLRTMKYSAELFNCRTMYYTHYYHHHPPPHYAIMVRNQRGGPVQRLTQSHLLAYLVSQSSRVSQLSNKDEQSGSSAHNHSTTLVPGSAVEHSNSGKKSFDSIRFDSRYRIDFFDSIRFGNLINLLLVH